MKLKVNYIGNDEKKIDEFDLIGHPLNQKLSRTIEYFLNRETSLNVTDMTNNRTIVVLLSTIETISSLGHMSQVVTTDGKKYYLNKRLKELVYLEKELFVRINQSTILNLEKISEFNVEQHARLKVTTQNKTDYLVSRHYAKNIKERLS